MTELSNSDMLFSSDYTDNNVMQRNNTLIMCGKAKFLDEIAGKLEKVVV